MRALKKISLTGWIMVSIVVGIFVGWQFPVAAQSLQFLSNIFLHLIKCIVVPLIFGTLVVGIAGHAGDLKSVGRLALKSLVYFEVVTTLALLVGLGAVNFFQPGVGVELRGSNDAGQQLATNKISFAGVIEHIAPQSFFDAAARNDVLQVVIFALLFAVALARVSGKSQRTMLDFCESLSEVMFKFTGLVMWLAPFGVGAAVAFTIGKNGFGVMLALGKLVLTLYGALFVFILVVLVPVMLIARIPVLRFFQAVREPALLAFSTASSEAALPDALRRMEKFGVPKRIVAFVLPAGYSFNLDGSTLYLAVAEKHIGGRMMDQASNARGNEANRRERRRRPKGANGRPTATPPEERSGEKNRDPDQWHDRMDKISCRCVHLGAPDVRGTRGKGATKASK